MVSRRLEYLHVSKVQRGVPNGRIGESPAETTAEHSTWAIAWGLDYAKLKDYSPLTTLIQKAKLLVCKRSPFFLMRSENRARSYSFHLEYGGKAIQETMRGGGRPFSPLP